MRQRRLPVKRERYSTDNLDILVIRYEVYATASPRMQVLSKRECVGKGSEMGHQLVSCILQVACAAATIANVTHNLMKRRIADHIDNTNLMATTRVIN